MCINNDTLECLFYNPVGGVRTHQTVKRGRSLLLPLYNSGILSYHCLLVDLHKMAIYTYASNEDITEQEESFRETVGYDDHSVLQSCRGSMESTAQGPEWLNVL